MADHVPPPDDAPELQKKELRDGPLERPRRTFVQNFGIELSRLPERPLTGGMLAGGLVGFLALAPTVAMATHGEFAWWLFLGVPFASGFASAIILGWRRQATLKACIWASLWSVLTIALGLTVVRVEGAVCLLISLPLALPMAILGTWIGREILRFLRSRGLVAMPAAILLPWAVIIVGAQPSSPNDHSHTSVKVVDATPEKIWPYLFNLQGLPPPAEWPFRLGMAYPLETRAWGSRRECVLSTGTMPERIVESVPNRRLKFEVMWTPPSMRETNPFGAVHSWHNEHGFQCLAGQFELRPLAGGRTLVIATSWYRHVYAPDWYWTLWTDATVAAVHHRVLDEIERRVTRSRG